MDEKVSPYRVVGPAVAVGPSGPGSQRDVDATPGRAAVVRRVDAGPADQDVGPEPANQYIVAAAAVERVITPAASK